MIVYGGKATVPRTSERIMGIFPLAQQAGPHAVTDEGEVLHDVFNTGRRRSGRFANALGRGPVQIGHAPAGRAEKRKARMLGAVSSPAG